MRRIRVQQQNRNYEPQYRTEQHNSLIKKFVHNRRRQYQRSLKESTVFAIRVCIMRDRESSSDVSNNKYILSIERALEGQYMAEREAEAEDGKDGGKGRAAEVEKEGKGDRD